MNVNWTPLRTEFAQWRAEGLMLPFWWRDDDAIEATDALSHLTELAEDAGVPVHLAIIPRDATNGLVAKVDQTRMLIPVVHGWAHENHAPADQKKAEFGVTRTRDDVVAELSKGKARLQDMFGARLAPMFVPPWNRIDPAIMPALADLGYDAVSTFLPRKQSEAAPGLARINTHLDPIFWRGTRGLVDPEVLVENTVAMLRDRRSGKTDIAEPFGYLTHHLVHDDDIWAFSKQFLNEMCEGPIALYRHDEKEQT